MSQRTQNLRAEQDGVTTIEYALIAAFIALVVAGSVMSVGTSLNAFFGRLEGCLSALTVAACT